MWSGLHVRERASKFYGCDLAHTKGIAIQNMGGKPGAHWSESTMADELMTPYSGVEPEQVSPMLLAFMEDTFWYKSDYSMVENYRHNIGDKRACEQKTLCPEKPLCKIGTSNFITSDYKGMGYCNKDSNGCAIEVKYSNMDITKPKPKQPAPPKPQSDAEFVSNAKEYQCWCYSDGERKFKCSNIKTNWKQ